MDLLIRSEQFSPAVEPQDNDLKTLKLEPDQSIDRALIISCY